MKTFFSCLLFLIVLTAHAQNPLINAHAHNDYEHAHPLADALSCGFTSVEADVWLIDGELYVYHDYPEHPQADRTLEELYLRPLLQKVEMSDKIYPNFGRPFYLMIDFKSEAVPTYSALKAVLKNYETLLSSDFKVFISGNRPIKEVIADEAKWAALDGRPADIGKGISAEMMPVISENFHKVCTWDGKGKLSKTEKSTLETFIRSAHNEGKLVRFWATPDTKNSWKQLQQAGVDLINTDDLKGLSSYLNTLK